MAIKVVTSKDAWAGFIRRAKRAFPKEHMEALWGEETVDSYRITDFKRIKASSTGSSLDADNKAEAKRQRWLAQQSGKTFLGTVHTHPRADYDTAPSAQDHVDGIIDGEKVMGVVVIYKKKDSTRFVTEIDWWFPQAKMEFELLPE